MMEMIKIQPNPIEAYQPQPTLPFNVDGTLLSKEGKHITVGAEIEGKKVEFDLRLNEEIAEDVGDHVHIEKEKVMSGTVRKEAFGLEGAGEEESGARDVRRILEELGLSHTVDNVKLIEWMMTAGIELTRDSVHSFVMSEKHLNRLQEELSVELIAKMTLRGMDVEHMSLQELSDSVSKLKNEPEKKSLSEWLGFERDLNYEEAEQVAKQLYGQKMGKDVYDAIIHLQHFNGELSKKNVNRITGLLSKIKALKEVSVQTFVAMEALNADCTVHSLYRMHRSFSMTSMTKNEQSHSFDLFTTKTDDERTGIERLIHLAGVEKNSLSLGIFRELTIQGMTANKENYQKVLSIKETVEEVLPQLDTKTIAYMETKGFDVENTSMEELRLLLREPVTEPQDSVSSLNNLKLEYERNFDLTSKKIGIRELVSLIRSDSDMTLKELQKKLDETDIAGVKEPVAVRTFSVIRSLNAIGEHLTREVISQAQMKNETLSLHALQEAAIEQSQSSEILIRPVSESASVSIQEEYMRIRSELTISMISRSVRENFDVEHAALSQVSAFIKQGQQAYDQAKEFHRQLKDTVGQSKVLIPSIMKNSLDMNLREIMEISQFLHGRQQIDTSLEALQANDENPKKERIKRLEKQLSDKIRAGESFAREYQNLIQAQTDFSENHADRDSKGNSDPFRLGTVKKLSRGTIVMQVPIELDGEENHLNILIPKNKNGLSKKEMSFFLSLRTDRLGTVNMALEVSGRNVHLKLDEENRSLEERIPRLRETLSEKGFRLKVENLK